MITDAQVEAAISELVSKRPPGVVSGRPSAQMMREYIQDIVRLAKDSGWSATTAPLALRLNRLDQNDAVVAAVVGELDDRHEGDDEAVEHLTNVLELVGPIVGNDVYPGELSVCCLCAERRSGPSARLVRFPSETIPPPRPKQGHEGTTDMLVVHMECLAALTNLLIDDQV